MGLPGGSYVMAAFTHLNPEGCPFHHGGLWRLHCAPPSTPAWETVYHRGADLRAHPGAGPEGADAGDPGAVQRQPHRHPRGPAFCQALYHATDYGPAQAQPPGSRRLLGRTASTTARCATPVTTVTCSIAPVWSAGWTTPVIWSTTGAARPSPHVLEIPPLR